MLKNPSRYTDALDTILTLPVDLSALNVVELRKVASLLRIESSIRSKTALLEAVASVRQSLIAYLAHRFQTNPKNTSESAPPTGIVDATTSTSPIPQEPCIEVPNTFLDTARFEIITELSDAQKLVVSRRRLRVTDHKTKTTGSQIFLYLNGMTQAAAEAEIASVSVLLAEMHILTSLTVDKTCDISMTTEDFMSGTYFPGFKWSTRNRQWEHTDSNGILTRIYDKTHELLTRGIDSPKWLKGKLDSYDRGVSYALHTIRFEARHVDMVILTSTPLHVPQEALDYETSQTYINTSSEVVSLISLAIKSKTRRQVAELVQTFFSYLQDYFGLGVGADRRFSEFKARLKKLHPELAPELSKIRRNR